MRANGKAQGRARRKRPKYEQVKTWLRRKIESGQFPAGTRLPTQTEWPRILKVGGVTVRRALNDLAREGWIVQRRRAGSFVTDRRRPPLIAGRHLHLGLLWNEDIAPHGLHETFLGAMTRGVLGEWGVGGVVPDWSASGLGKTTGCTWAQVERGLKVSSLGQHVRSRERHPPLEAVVRMRFDGVICLSIIEDDWLAAWLDQDVPTVLADYPRHRFRHRCDQVYVDPLPGYRAAVEELVRAGARRIHFVGTYHRLPAERVDIPVEEWLAHTDRKMRADPDSHLRLSAYRQAMDECGLPVREEDIHFCSYDPGCLEALGDHLARLPSGARPEAVVCHEVEQAERLIERFDVAGRSLAGVGASFRREHRGRARAVYVSGEQLGAVAADLLIARLQKPERPKLNVGVAMEAGGGEAHEA